jgi:hypothetical protein
VSIQSAPYYWLVCDDCATRSTEGGDISAWAEESGAIADALDALWTIGGRGGAPETLGHLCISCSTKIICPDCGAYRSPEGVCGDC